MIWYYFNIIISSLFSSLSSLYLISSSWYSFVWCNYHQSNVFKCVHLEYANGVWSFLLSYPQSHSSLSPFPLSLFTSHFLFYFHLSLFTRPFSLIIPHFSFFIPHFMFFCFFFIFVQSIRIDARTRVLRIYLKLMNSYSYAVRQSGRLYHVI